MKKKVSITLHLFALIYNSLKEVISVCLSPIIHVEKTLKGKIRVVIAHLFHRSSIKVNPRHRAERLFSRKTHTQEGSKANLNVEMIELGNFS